MKSKVVWKDGMAFEAQLDGFDFVIDAAEAVGGRNLGPRPKGLLLTALAGCTAMDVIAILGKMRVEVDSLEVSADGTVTEEHPKKISEITIDYRVKGDGLPIKKILRAVQLSEERYCGVSATLAPGVKMSSTVHINGALAERADEG